MLGFVVCAIDFGATIDKVNSHLDVTEHLHIQNTAMSPMVRLESRRSAPDMFLLYHLWTDFSGIVE